MLKNVYLALLMFTFIQFSASNLTAQTSKNTLDGMYLSFKGGFHTGDYDQSYDNFSSGFSIDGTVEVHTGKNWYVGLNYDISFGKDKDYFGYERSFTNYNFSPLIKYRFFIDETAMYIGIGIGSSSLAINGNNNDHMLAANVRMSVDFKIDKNVVASGEVVYHSMTEIDMGVGNSYNIAMFKVGL
jgi:outer membrane protein with beta-barrel domain